jgi:hypothetical protein
MKRCSNAKGPSNGCRNWFEAILIRFPPSPLPLSPLFRTVLPALNTLPLGPRHTVGAHTILELLNMSVRRENNKGRGLICRSFQRWIQNEIETSSNRRGSEPNDAPLIQLCFNVVMRNYRVY